VPDACLQEPKTANSKPCHSPWIFHYVEIIIPEYMSVFANGKPDNRFLNIVIAAFESG
jgi:hypothetical protein